MVVVAEREVEAGAVDLRAHAEHGDVRVGGAARGDETDEMRKRLAGRDRRGRVTARSHSKRQYDRRKGASCRHHSPPFAPALKPQQPQSRSRSIGGPQCRAPVSRRRRRKVEGDLALPPETPQAAAKKRAVKPSARRSTA